MARRVGKLPNGKFARWSTVTDSFFDDQLTFVEMVNCLVEERVGFHRNDDSEVEWLMNPANWMDFEKETAWMWFMQNSSEQEMREWLIARGADEAKIASIKEIYEKIKEEADD